MHIRVLRGLLNTVTFYTWFSLFQIKTMSALASRPFTFGNSWKNSCFSQTATAAVSSGSVDPRAYSKLKTPRESLGYGERGKIGRRWIMTNWADPFVSTTKRVSSRKQLIPSDSCISSVSHTCDWERKRERERNRFLGESPRTFTPRCPDHVRYVTDDKSYCLVNQFLLVVKLTSQLTLAQT